MHDEIITFGSHSKCTYLVYIYLSMHRGVLPSKDIYIPVCDADCSPLVFTPFVFLFRQYRKYYLLAGVKLIRDGFVLLQVQMVRECFSSLKWRSLGLAFVLLLIDVSYVVCLANLPRPNGTCIDVPHHLLYPTPRCIRKSLQIQMLKLILYIQLHLLSWILSQVLFDSLNPCIQHTIRFIRHDILLFYL